jgi:hypothetical protein
MALKSLELPLGHYNMHSSQNDFNFTHTRSLPMDQAAAHLQRAIA